MKSNTIHIILDWNEREIPLTVEYTIHPPERGYRDRYGVPMEPDWPAECEIESIKDDRGVEVELPQAELTYIEQLCFEDANNCD